MFYGFCCVLRFVHHDVATIYTFKPDLTILKIMICFMYWQSNYFGDKFGVNEIEIYTKDILLNIKYESCFYWFEFRNLHK